MGAASPNAKTSQKHDREFNELARPENSLDRSVSNFRMVQNRSSPTPLLKGSASQFHVQDTHSTPTEL